MTPEELKQTYKIFVEDEKDPEIKAENTAVWKDLEKRIGDSNLIKSWREHDFTKMLMSEVRSQYRSLLAEHLQTENIEQQRLNEIWAQRKTMEWVLHLAEDNPDPEILRIQRDIQAFLAK